MRFNADMKRKYDALVTEEKPPKLALTAIMRKLIILTEPAQRLTAPGSTLRTPISGPLYDQNWLPIILWMAELLEALNPHNAIISKFQYAKENLP